MQSRGYGHKTRGNGDVLVGIQLLYVFNIGFCPCNLNCDDGPLVVCKDYLKEGGLPSTPR